MIRSFAIFALLFLLGTTAVNAQTCLEDSPFDCPDDTHCTLWSDGCNDCSCNDGDINQQSLCTLKYCPCYEDDSCVAVCKDNDQCTPKPKPEPVGSLNLFDCPEGTRCTRWSDGCNNCNAASEDQPLAACTEMMCPCYNDNTCVPVCWDNSECIPIDKNASGAASATAGTIAVGVTSMLVMGYVSL